MKIHPLLLSLILTSVLTETGELKAQSQDSTMNQTMRLERDFSPIVQQKSKIDRQPASQPLQEKKSDASYANWQVSSVQSSEIGIVPAGQVIAERRDPQNGYFELSAGNYWNTDLKAGVNFGDLSVDAKGFFTSGNLKLPHQVATDEGYENKRWDSRLMTGELKGTYSVTLIDDAQFEAHVAAAGTAVKTFPYMFLHDNYIDTLQVRSTEPGKQRWGQFRADASYETDLYKVALQYDYTKLTTPDSLPCNWFTNTLMFKGQYGWYDNDEWQLSVNMDLGGVFGKEKNYFIIYPDLHFSYMPAYGEWRRVYANLGFGSHRESLMELMNQMPLACFDTEYKNSMDIFRLQLGYEDNEQGYLRWGAELQARYTKDKLCAEAAPIDTTRRDGIYMKITQDDCFSFGAKAHVDYEYNRYFGAKANVQFQSFSSEKADMAQPHVMMSGHLLSNPGDFKFDLGIDLGLNRKMRYKEYDYSLGSIADLNFRADWQANEQVNVFLFGRNLLNVQYELWPAVPAQGINLHAGFRMIF